MERLLLPFVESTISNLIFMVDPTDPVLPTNSQGQTSPPRPRSGCRGCCGPYVKHQMKATPLTYNIGVQGTPD